MEENNIEVNEVRDVKSVCMTEFANRHFSGKSSVSQIRDMSSDDFVSTLNFELSEFHSEEGYSKVKEMKYGNFPDISRIVTLANITKAKATVMEIGLNNYQYLRTDYSARTADELPVLTRWFELPPGFKPAVAENLSVVMYSRIHLIAEFLDKGSEAEKLMSKDKEAIELVESKLIELSAINKKKISLVRASKLEEAAMVRSDEKELLSNFGIDDLSTEMIDKLSELREEWCIVAIMAHNGLDPEPMSPITIMRNSLGMEQGGNGVPLNKKEYEKSVEFWSRHANVK